MADNIYRKSMLERMSSPEQLDKMIVITSPSFWLALAGGALMIVVALIWAVAGRLPVKVEATGICVPNQKAYTLASESGGMVASIEVEVGDTVEKGQVLAKLDGDAVQQKVDKLNERIQKVEAVTIDSTDDEVTADNSELINMKSQIQRLALEKSQNTTLIAKRESELAEVKKQAEADKYAAQQRADADLYQRQKDAEAKQFEAVRAAEARKAQAEADRYSKEQEAAGIRAVGEAEASAIQAKGIAEAEAMEKKAEAYAKYNKAAVAEMMIKVLPDVAAKIAEPLGQIDKITIIGGGDGSGNGVDQVAGNVPAVMAKLFESMKEATGIDLSEIVKADTYDAKVNRNVNVTGLDDINLVVKEQKKPEE